MKSYYHIDRMELPAPYRQYNWYSQLPANLQLHFWLSKCSFHKWQHALGLQNKSIYNFMDKEHPLP